MQDTSPYALTYMSLAILAIIFDTTVIYHFLYKIGTFTAATTYLVYLLHVTSLLQNITTIPILYTGNQGLCAFVGFLHYYFGLLNIAAISLLTVVYYRYTTATNQRINRGVHAVLWMRYASVLALITLLPFSTDSYGATYDGTWCSVRYGHPDSILWSVLVFYLWAFFAIVFCGGTCVYIVFYTAKHDISLSRSIYSSLGVYIAVTLCYLIPILGQLQELSLIPAFTLHQRAKKWQSICQ
jgi:hypothetical protein